MVTHFYGNRILTLERLEYNSGKDSQSSNKGKDLTYEVHWKICSERRKEEIYVRMHIKVCIYY